MRCRKWWWSIFLFSLGAGATNAYLVYLSACEAEGLRKKDIKSHREFLEELCEQLCHPELRICEATTKPPEREMERPSPAREERKEREANNSGGDSSGAHKAGKLTWARVAHARAGYDANLHTFTDPI